MSWRLAASPSARTAMRATTVPPASHQVLHGLQAAAGGDHVVHQDDALAADQVRVIPARYSFWVPAVVMD